MKKATNNIINTASIMILVTLLAKLLGMFRDILITANFGTSQSAVAYEAASRLPITLFDFALGGVITAVFIPLFNEILIKESREKAFEFANKYFNLILTLTFTISVLGMVFSPWLISFLAPQISPNTKELATLLSRIMFPMIIFTGIAFCYVGILQSHEKYTLPAIMSLVSNLVMVVYFYTLCEDFGVFGLSVSLLIGWFLQASIQAPSAHKLGFRYKPTLRFNDIYIKRALMLALPILVCSWLQPVCNAINTRFASSFYDGSAITMVSYANRLYIIIVGIFSFVATNLLFPKFSQVEAEGDSEKSNEFARVSIKALLFIMIPLSVGIFVLSQPITRAIYMRGLFTAQDAETTSSILTLFALGIPFMSVNEILTKLFFAKQRVKLPMLASIISIAINILAVSILVNFVGLSGIGIASSLTIAICTILNYIFLTRQSKILKAKDFIDIIKQLLSAVIMAVAVYYINSILPLSSDILRVIICGGCGIIIYFAFSLILPTEQVDFIKQKFLKRG